MIYGPNLSEASALLSKRGKSKTQHTCGPEEAPVEESVFILSFYECEFHR